MRLKDEHLRLRNSIDIIRSTCINLENQLCCQNCNREQIATCKGRLTSFSYNLISISESHFDFEESIMLPRAGISNKKEAFHNHQQSHQNILKEMRETLKECALLDSHGRTDECYRLLYKRASKLYEEHGRLFDLS